MSTNRLRSSRFSLAIIHLIFILFSAVCIIPLIAVISISLSDEVDVIKHGYMLIPKRISTLAYEYIFKNPEMVLNSYRVSIFVTVTGLFVGLMLTSMIAYTVSRRDYKFKNQLMFFIFFTMLFNGGLVPQYILIKKYLHLHDTIWVLIVPGLVNSWYIILLRSFFQKISMELIEAAKIDGAREFRIYFTIILPLSKPALGTVGLFIALHYWNDWFTGLLYIDKKELLTLQVLLQRIMAELNFLNSELNNIPMDVRDTKALPSESARMAMCILAAGPMLIAFPFFQKFFVKGLTVGSLKG